MIEEKELLSLNAQGMIPGPGESEEAFMARVKILKSHSRLDALPRAHWNLSRHRLIELFDFEPECLAAFYSNRSLTPWQGAATWIEEGNIPLIQLREGFRKGSYLGYGRSEILSHEAIHAARSAFDEPMAEEFFAFMASETPWRRMLGPILRRPWEAWLFLSTLFIGLFFPLGSGISALLAIMALVRLARLHRRMGKASQCLLMALGSVKKARSVLFRLTDAEIKKFAKGEEFFSYARKQSCLRWRLLQLIAAR